MTMIDVTPPEAPQSPVEPLSAPESALTVISAIVPAQPGQVLVTSAESPEAMIEMASHLATVLGRIIEQQKLYTVIGGKKYIQVEAWETIGRLDNVVAREAALPIRWEDGGYEAQVELVRLSDGMVIGRASSICGMRGDKPWDGRPEYARRSMAVTRATSRAFRQQYSWIVVLAGYEPTPADEMPPDTAVQSVPSATAQPGVATGTAAPGASRRPGAEVSLTGVVSKVADGIRRDANDGTASYDVTFKADGKTYHAMTSGDMAERMVREVKPSVGDPITVEGRYHERAWNDKDGTKMPAVKEVHDISRIVIRDEVTLGDVVIHPGEVAAGVRNTGEHDVTIKGNLVDEARLAFDGLIEPMWGDEGYIVHDAIKILSAERLLRPKSGTYVVHGSGETESGNGAEFITDHDFDPPPEKDSLVTLTGKFVKAPDGRILVLGQIS